MSTLGRFHHWWDGGGLVACYTTADQVRLVWVTEHPAAGLGGYEVLVASRDADPASQGRFLTEQDALARVGEIGPMRQVTQTEQDQILARWGW